MCIEYITLKLAKSLTTHMEPWSWASDLKKYFCNLEIKSTQILRFHQNKVVNHPDSLKTDNFAIIEWIKKGLWQSLAR